MRKPRQLKKNAYYHVCYDEHMKYANEVFNVVKYQAKRSRSTVRQQKDTYLQKNASRCVLKEETPKFIWSSPHLG